MGSKGKEKLIAFCVALGLVLFTIAIVAIVNGGIKSGSGSTPTSTFTNKYGTPTTKCAHPGCNNYIATSGDTNCCPQHSNRCLNCGKYCDGDAMYCGDCIKSCFD